MQLINDKTGLLGRPLLLQIGRLLPVLSVVAPVPVVEHQHFHELDQRVVEDGDLLLREEGHDRESGGNTEGVEVLDEQVGTLQQS